MKARDVLRLLPGLALTAVVGALILWPYHAMARARADAQWMDQASALAATAETEVVTQVAALDRLLDEAARRMAEASAAEEDATPATPPAREPAEAEEARRLLSAAQAAFDPARAPAGAVLTVYDVNAPDQPAVGRTDGSGALSLLAEVPVQGRLAGATVEALTRRTSGDSGWIHAETPWTWFEQAPQDRVRLCRAVVQHEVEAEVEEDGRSPTLVQTTLLLVASAPLALAGTFVARCDLADGRLAPTLPSAGPVLPSGLDASWSAALAPGRGGWRFPVAEPGARLERLLTPDPRRGTPDWLKGMYVFVGFSLLGTWWRSWRAWRATRSPTAPPPDVTAEAAHEMRTPLTVLRGALDVALRRERSPEEYRDTLRLCLQEVKGLQDLQDAVLFLGRGARAAPVREPVDLSALLEAEVARVATAHPERRVSVTGSVPGAVVQGDPSLLSRLLANLLDNAALHSVPGGAVRAALSRSGDLAVITVEDDGPGIPAPRAERIFERFYRGPEASRRGVPGSGLGLPIARWVAQLHGGTLTLDPAPTDRAVFRLVLPVTAARD